MTNFDAALDNALSEGRVQPAQGFAYIEVDGLGADTLSPLDWLFSENAGRRVLHQSGHDGDFLAGSGVADELKIAAPSTTKEVESALLRLKIPQAHPGWVGGTRFDIASSASPAWQSFGAARFVLPRRVYWKSEGRCFFGRHQNEIAPNATTPAGLIASRLPRDESYEARASEGLKFIEGGLEKVVVAGAFHFDISLNIESTLRSLSAHEPKASLFWIEEGLGGFFGATPERLYERAGRNVVIDALAGSAALGEGEKERLLNDDKELREHAHVRDFIKARLSHLGEVSCASTPHVFELSSVQHLRTLVNVRLREARPMLSHLHPTPAVCGTPTQDALAAIRRIEQFDRGYYAGAIGRVTHQGERFNVALRCALYSADALSVFGGAGIVQGSLAPNEAQEVKRKIKTLQQALESR